MPKPDATSEFDGFANTYDESLQQGLRVTGETKTYFATRRLRWLAQRLHQLQQSPQTVLDYGCGTGTSTRYFFEILGVSSVVGIDVSEKSLAEARRDAENRNAQFYLPQDYPHSAGVDVAFCNGVLHHVQPEDRVDAARYVFDRLRSGGVFALWENNGWNPGTRYVMNRIPFDSDAITLTARETRRLLRAAHFEVLRTDFLFIFPRLLRQLRWIEPFLTSLPIGAQYMVLGRKP